MTKRPRPAPKPPFSRAITPRHGPVGVGRRAVAYLRVSTGGQSTENQRPDLERLVEARGLELVGEYVETASAARVRPAFEHMLAGACRGEFDVLVVWALDRFGRSMTGNLAALLELDRIGVQVISVREPWLDTGGPVRELLIAICSWVAEQERTRLGERTRAGLDRARANGKKLGRPERRFDMRTARKLRSQGLSLRAISKQLHVPATTIHRALWGDLRARRLDALKGTK